METTAAVMDTTSLMIIASILLFLLYKTGLMDLTQKSIERGATMVDRNLEVMDEESIEKHSRKLGKLASKYQDTGIVRADRKSLALAREEAIKRSVEAK